MRRVLLILLMYACTGLLAVPASDRVRQKDIAFRGDEALEMPGALAGWQPGDMRTTGLVGDTLFVGSTGWDLQHNGSAGRQIGYYAGEGDWRVTFSWMKLYGVQLPLPRHVVQTTVRQDSAKGYLLEEPARIDNGFRSGYTTLAMDAATGEPFPVYHYAESSQDVFASVAARRSMFIPDTWNLFTVPSVFDREHIWPKAVHGANDYLHIVSHHAHGGQSTPTQLSYMRYQIVEPNVLVPARPGGTPKLLSLALMNVSADVVTNRDGSRVAVGACVDRNRTEDENFRGGTGQWNNDLYIWQSWNSGQSFAPPVNVTSFVGPYPAALPDTTFANGDTMRAYTDCSLIFDDEDKLHAAFTAGNFDYLREIVYYESRIYHWMRDENGDPVWTMIHHQPFAGEPETWARSTDRPSLYFDHDTGILWCVMEAVDWGENHTDYSRASGIANTDILISASPPGKYNGLLWTKPVNVTNTKYELADGAPVGASRSETDVSVALNSDGDFLHLFYMQDLDGGCAVQFQGVMTDNPVVYHRIRKSTLLQRFDEVGEWVENYPLHIDHEGYWQDPGEYAWEEFGGFYSIDRASQLLVQLELEATSDEIPAGGGVISAMTRFQNHSEEEYPGADFWTMVTFPNGSQYGPVLWFTVDVPANFTVTNQPINQIVPYYAPYGRYFYSMYAGDYPESYTSDTFMFTKLAGGGGEFDGDNFIWDPEDWPAYMSPFIEEEEPHQNPNPDLPQQFGLSQAYPNPFNPAATLTLDLPRHATVHAVVYDLMGREVAVLLDGRHQAGRYTLEFDGTSLASGVYFLRAEVVGRFTTVRKLVLMK